jgi:hypothetical protein
VKTFVEGANLTALAAKASQHYASHALTLPDHCSERVFHIHDGTTGRNTQVQLVDGDPAALLAHRPLRLRYSTQANGRLLEAAILVPTPHDALRLAAALVQDLGVPATELTIVKEGAQRFHVLAAGPFRGLDTKMAARLLSYLQPDDFAIPNGRILNPHQRHYQDHIEQTLTAWRTMPAAALEEHVRKNTDLGTYAQSILDFFANHEHPAASLGSCPPLLTHVRKSALRATFPPFDLRKTLDNPLVPVPGSVWLPPGIVAQAIPLAGGAP